MSEVRDEAAHGGASGLELEAGEDSPYVLRLRVDIAAVLRDVVRTRGLATVHYGSGQEALLTPLLQFDPSVGEIVFDCSGAERVNQGLLRAAKLVFASSHDKVKIRFTTGPARLIQHEGAKAFCVRMPDSMLRLQRREFYRVLAPVARPVRCIVPFEDEKGTRSVDARLHDISQGGVALIVQPGELPPTLGARYERCRILLPDAGNVVVTLQTANLSEMHLLNGKSAMRVGCQFVRPSMSALALIQRYIMRLESEKKARD
jgi:c-di-GMP-binding flagellar brake protein YcgR